MIHNTMLAGLLVTLATLSPAQTQEPNTPEASLEMNGMPAVSPIGVRGDQAITIETSSTAALARYSLVFGQRAITPLAPEVLEIDLAQPVITLVDGLGLGISPPVFASNPGTLPFQSDTLTLPPSTLPGGFGGTLQGIILSPQLPRVFDLTGAVEFSVIPSLGIDSFSGDDEIRTYVASPPLRFYGQLYGLMTVSTNGWVKFGAPPSDSDPTESTSAFLDGSIGGAPAGSGPIIASLWADLTLDNRPSQRVTVLQAGFGRVTIRWEDVDFASGGNLGTLELLIDNGRGVVRTDFQASAARPSPREGIVGISDGGSTGMATPVEVDFTANPFYFPSNPVENPFQNFRTGPHAEPFDMHTSFFGLLGFPPYNAWQWNF